MSSQPSVPADRVAYHRLLREAPRYRWWRPLLLIILTGVYALSLSALVQTLLAPLLTSGAGAADVAARLSRPNTQDPVAIVITLASIASWLVAVPAAMWSVGLAPIARLWSVRLTPRWGLLLRCLVFAALALVVMEAITIGVAAVTGPGLGQPTDFDAGLALWSVLIVVLLVPLQAAGEEFVFRGALFQALGSWIKNPIVPIVIPTLIFASLHVYDGWGLAQIMVLGLLSGWLVWRTGGLEAAIALHVINNLAVYLLLISGITGVTAQQEGAAGPVSLIVTTLGFLGYSWVVIAMFDRGGGERWSAVARAADRPTPAGRARANRTRDTGRN